MRIGMVLPTQYPPDIRVEKEIHALSAEHDISLLCPRRGSQIAREQCGPVQVRRVFSDMQRWLANLQLMATCTSYHWTHAIRQFVHEYRIDVLHVHDLPLIGPAMIIARECNIPIVADLHENYPQMIAAAKSSTHSQFSLPNMVQHYLVSIKRWQQYEAQVVPQVDAVIVVIEEAYERLRAINVPKERLRVVANYTNLSDIDQPVQPTDETHTHFTIVYAGGFAATRDLRTVVDAAALISPETIPHLQIQLLGGQGAEYENMCAYVRSKGVEQRVNVFDWRPMAEVWQHIEQSHACLVPHVRSPHTDSTIPHKLFQYMARQKPVIVSDCAPLARIVTSNACGLVYPSGNAEELAKAIVHLYQSPEQRTIMGQHGRSAVLREYNWEHTAEGLLQLYRTILPMKA